MSEMIKGIEEKLATLHFTFTKKPIVIGGCAMEYHGIRKSGSDIDLVICNEDYQELAKKYPEKRKDIWGDLGIVIGEFEIWRSIQFFDYEFFQKDAADVSSMYILSIERLLFTRCLVVDVTAEIKKYKDDYEKILEYYYEQRNQAFFEDAKLHYNAYSNAPNGIIWQGKYEAN